MKKPTGEDFKYILSGVGGFVGSKIANKVVQTVLAPKILDVITPLAVSAALLMYGEKHLGKYTMPAVVGSAIAAITNLSAMLGNSTVSKAAMAGYDQPSKMGSRVHAEAGLSGHDMMSVDNDESEDDLYQGIFADSGV